MDQEFADLIPLFVEEARDRIDRLAGCVPRLESDPEALVEAKRELHTLKGAGRMLQLGSLAELSHAAEELLGAPRPGLGRLMTRVVDGLSAMVEALARGEETAVAPDLAALLGGDGNGSAAPGATAEPLPDPTPEPVPELVPAGGPTPGPAAQPKTAPAAPRGAPAAAEIRIDATALDAIGERATQVRIMALGSGQYVDRIYELARLAEQGLHEPQPTQVLAVLATMLRRLAIDVEGNQRRLTRAAEEQLEKMLAVQLQPLRGPMLLLARYARELARSLGREVEVELAGEETRLDRRIARELEEALIHLLRNAVDHGIEPPAAREQEGKPRAGRIRLLAAADGPRVRLTIADDGAGVDHDRVLAHAVRTGLVDAATAAGMGRSEALRLLFAPGFSTRKSVSEISGRGVGLDVVAAAVSRVGGEVLLDAEPGRGTTVVVEVPVARRGEDVLLLTVGQLRLAIPSAVVKSAVALAASDVLERDGRTFANLGDRLVPFVPLARVYAQPAAEAQLLLEGAVSGQQLAIAVDDVIGEQEILVRPLTRSAATDRLLDGVALLASGEPVGVLSPAALAQREYLRAQPLARPVQAFARVRVLLVDDSLVTREMERRLLEDAGFEVVAVAAAEEALAQLGEGRFDCVVTDIEMPGMDGFELTQHLRAIEHFQQLPVVVVSTRDRPEDRLRGLKAGADAYLTKQSLDAGELVELVRRLGGRA